LRRDCMLRRVIQIHAKLFSASELSWKDDQSEPT
jgi:hypothetical protein